MKTFTLRLENNQETLTVAESDLFVIFEELKASQPGNKFTVEVSDEND